MIKKIFNWYCTQAEENDFSTPSCLIPVRYIKNV